MKKISVLVLVLVGFLMTSCNDYYDKENYYYEKFTELKDINTDLRMKCTDLKLENIKLKDNKPKTSEELIMLISDYQNKKSIAIEQYRVDLLLNINRYLSEEEQYKPKLKLLENELETIRKNHNFYKSTQQFNIDSDENQIFLKAIKDHVENINFLKLHLKNIPYNLSLTEMRINGHHKEKILKLDSKINEAINLLSNQKIKSMLDDTSITDKDKLKLLKNSIK